MGAGKVSFLSPLLVRLDRLGKEAPRLETLQSLLRLSGLANFVRVNIHAVISCF